MFLHLQKAREFLSDEAYKSLKSSIKVKAKLTGNGRPDRFRIKSWAETKRCNTFYPLVSTTNRSTAEKHDSFFTLKSDGTALEEFDGAALDSTGT